MEGAFCNGCLRVGPCINGRGERIRTSNPPVPKRNQMFYLLNLFSLVLRRDTRYLVPFGCSGLTFGL
jgi:hypothetical protein